MMESPVPESSLPSVPVEAAAGCRAPQMVVRVASPADLAILAGISPDRIAWVETSIDLAERPELEGLRLDLVLTDPAAQAARLYRLARQPVGPFVRVTLPAVPGLGRAGSAAIALGFPVRLLPEQAGPEALADLVHLLDCYLHDANASAPVEFYHSALARLLHGAPGTLWEVLERDPAAFPRYPSPEDLAGPPPAAHPPAERPCADPLLGGGGVGPCADPRRAHPPPEPGFVARHVAALEAVGAECVSCPVRDWCLGYFKWPDPAYACTGIRRLMDTLERASADLRRDLAEVERLRS